MIFTYRFIDAPEKLRWTDKYKRILQPKDLSNNEYEELNRKLGVQDGDFLYIGFQPREHTVPLLASFPC